MSCACCQRKITEQTSRSVHRDGSGVGPVVRVCHSCFNDMRLHSKITTLVRVHNRHVRELLAANRGHLGIADYNAGYAAHWSAVLASAWLGVGMAYLPLPKVSFRELLEACAADAHVQKVISALGRSGASGTAVLSAVSDLLEEV